MTKTKLIYEGKAKRVYQMDNPNLFIQEFKAIKILCQENEG